MKSASVRFGVLMGIAALCVLSGGLSGADAPAARCISKRKETSTPSPSSSTKR